MLPVLDTRLSQPPFSRPVNWRGRSGRYYALSPERLDDFMLRGNELYLIALGSMVLWAGSSGDVINDAQSRARFRLALATADRVFRVEASEDDVERMTIIWDLEGGVPVSGLSAA
ncbi:MAG TPA: hypothetical protein GYA10_14075 [Alphaproteobacteria bacterium]|nr:hypothetical protein [Alphaproteobacteria bacterium]